MANKRAYTERICVEAADPACPKCQGTKSIIKTSRTQEYPGANKTVKYEYRQCRGCPQIFVARKEV